MRYESLNASHTGAWIAPFSHSTALANGPHSALPGGTSLTSIGSPTEPALSNHLPAIPTVMLFRSARLDCSMKGLDRQSTPGFRGAARSCF
jgi:hypothetical protein